MVTDDDGNYCLEVPDEGATLVFTCIGYVAKEIAVCPPSAVNVQLQPDVTQLDDAVVVGHGVQSKRKVTGPIAKVTAKDIENMPVTSFDQVLRGPATGVQVTSSSGLPGEPVLVRTRSQTSINPGNDPLHIIDGVPIVFGSLTLNQTAVFGGLLNPLSGINPQDIASMEVLKDAVATAIYGRRGANSVILIATTNNGDIGKAIISPDICREVCRATELLDVLNTEGSPRIKQKPLTTLEIISGVASIVSILLFIFGLLNIPRWMEGGFIQISWKVFTKKKKQ